MPLSCCHCKFDNLLRVPGRARAELEERVTAMHRDVLAATDRMDRFKLAMNFNQARRGMGIAYSLFWPRCRARADAFACGSTI